VSGSLTTIRQAMRTAIAGAGWTVSRWTADQFGADTDSVLHHAFALATPDSVMKQPEGRQRASEGLRNVDTAVNILWAHRIRGDNQVADEDAAMDAEQELAARIKAITGIHILFERMSRRAGPEGWLLGRIELRVTHIYALT
jgi:hypothetical protein